jgi:hypothetical protein
MDASDDGVLHSMLFHSDTELAFGVVYNTCYGWGNFQCTNSSSAFQAKAFWDYFLDVDNNSGHPNNWQLGKAHAWSKDTMAPTINWDYSYGTWRAIIQGCLLFADPAQKLKNPHPNFPPEQPTKPDGPEEWVQFGEVTFESTASDPDGDSIEYWFDWGDGTDSGWVGPYGSGQTGQAAHIWTDVGEHLVKVKVRDEKFGQSPWSEPATINIVENEPPEKPIITGPKTGAPRVLLTFKVSAEDPEVNDVSYMVAWGDGQYAPYTELKPSGTEVTFSHAWNEGGEYTITAKAMDQYGAISPQAILNLKITKSRAVTNPILYQLLEKLIAQFPLLELLLNLI